MAEYKGIHGTKVQDYTTDPDNPITGQVWYNETANTIRVQSFIAAAWASGGNLNTARSLMGSAGIQTAALAFGGDSGSPPPATRDLAVTESYNGTNWTEVADLNASRRRIAGNGTTTSALATGGFEPPSVAKVESWNGSSWSETTDLNQARSSAGQAGADNTSSIVFGGANPAGALLALTETWNGSAWTEVNDLNTSGYGVTGVGIVTAALASDRANASDVAQTVVESWNGSSWTEVANLNTPRYYAGGSCSGTNTAALYFGGQAPPGVTAVNESWNGSSWTEIVDLSIARAGAGGSGIQSSALAFGGAPPYMNSTEEFTGGSNVTKTITTD